MGNGYKVFWTENALSELADTYEYLENRFTARELNKLSLEIDQTLKLISQNPRLFPLSESKGARKAVVRRLNTMYYRENQNTVEILSFFSNRQNPMKRKI